MTRISVVIATFGDKSFWDNLAQRAILSVKRQTISVDLVRVHADSLHEARNRGAEKSRSEFLIFLDADDELDPHYVENMLTGPDEDIRQPSTMEINGETESIPVLIPKRNLLIANYLVIGSMVRRDLFLKVGGFRNLPILEDWDLWIRCKLANATFGERPDAVYRIHVRSGSRNRNNEHSQVHKDIRRRYAKFQ